MHIGRGRQHGEHEAKRAGQNMALDPLDLLVAINTALALLRSRHNALRIKDGGGRLGGMAVLLAHRTREHTANVGPDPVVAKPVMPGSNRLPGAKIFGQVAPPAAGLVQIQAGVDHLAQIRRQRWVNRKIRRDGLPLRIRQVAQIAPAVVLVAFTMFRRPHGMLLLLHQERATGGADRCYTSATVKQGLIECDWKSRADRIPSGIRNLSRRRHRSLRPAWQPARPYPRSSGRLPPPPVRSPPPPREP